MAHQTGLLNQVAANHVDTHSANLVEIRLHWRRLLARIAAAQRGPDFASVYHRVIQQLASRVTVDGANVIGAVKLVVSPGCHIRFTK